MIARNWAQTESNEDLAYGGILIIAARWAPVAAALALALGDPPDLLELQIAVAVILSLAVANSALHRQLDREVAFSLIKTERLDHTGRERITPEARSMGHLGSSPHVVTSHEVTHRY